VGAARSRLAEVVGVGRLPKHREDDLGRGRCSRAGSEDQEGEDEKKGSSGCGPVTGHGFRVAPKRQTLAGALCALGKVRAS